jgi:hypothetical protein
MNARREGYLDERRLYTVDGVNAAVGLSVKALDEGRQAGMLHPVEMQNRLWYSGEELIRWILECGKRPAKDRARKVDVYA